MNECLYCENTTETVLCKDCSDEIQNKYIGPTSPKWEPKVEHIRSGDEWKYA